MLIAAWVNKTDIYLVSLHSVLDQSIAFLLSS